MKEKDRKEFIEYANKIRYCSVCGKEIVEYVSYITDITDVFTHIECLNKE